MLFKKEFSSFFILFYSPFFNSINSSLDSTDWFYRFQNTYFELNNFLGLFDLYKRFLMMSLFFQSRICITKKPISPICKCDPLVQQSFWPWRHSGSTPVLPPSHSESNPTKDPNRSSDPVAGSEPWSPKLEPRPPKVEPRPPKVVSGSSSADNFGSHSLSLSQGTGTK